MNTTLLFVYGTMLQGHKNFKRVQDCQFIDRGTTPGVLYHRGFCPAMIPGKGRVHGEIYAVPDDILRWIDCCEGFNIARNPHLNTYNRRIGPVTYESGATTLCSLYIYNKPVQGLPIITNGRYTEKEDQDNGKLHQFLRVGGSATDYRQFQKPRRYRADFGG